MQRFFTTLLKITIIEKPIPALFETTSIENPIMVAQNQRFINHCNRRSIVAVSKNASIRSPIATFYNHCYRLGSSFLFLINLIFETIYPNASKALEYGCPIPAL